MIQVCWFKWHLHFHVTSSKNFIHVCWIKWHSQVSSLRSKFCRRVLRCSHPHQTLSKGHFLLTLSWTFDKFSQQDSLNLQPCLQDWFEKGGVRGFQLYTYPLRWVGQWVNATSEFWHTGWLLTTLLPPDRTHDSPHYRTQDQAHYQPHYQPRDWPHEEHQDQPHDWPNDWFYD